MNLGHAEGKGDDVGLQTHLNGHSGKGHREQNEGMFDKTHVVSRNDTTTSMSSNCKLGLWALRKLTSHLCEAALTEMSLNYIGWLSPVEAN